MTNRLLTRVSIAAGLQIAGHERFWENMATSLEFTWDTNFLSALRSGDMKNKRTWIFQRNKGGKFDVVKQSTRKKATHTIPNLMGIMRACFMSLALQLIWRRKH